MEKLAAIHAAIKGEMEPHMDRELMVVSLSFRVITTLSHLKLGLLYR
jgi:hypothetical protein